MMRVERCEYRQVIDLRDVKMSFPDVLLLTRGGMQIYHVMPM